MKRSYRCIVWDGEVTFSVGSGPPVALLPKREKSSGPGHTRASGWKDAWPLLTWEGEPHRTLAVQRKG